MFNAMFFVLGSIIGSFLNVVIFRMPQGKSTAYPPSGCPKCGDALSWYELIPIVSFIIQQGKCRHCGMSISMQYPAVELVSGIIYVWLYVFFGLTMKLAIALFFTSLLITIMVIDFQHQIIPDKLNMAGAIFGFIALFMSDISLASALSGSLAGGIIMLIIAVISRGGMGGGDVKMVAMMGLFLGWKLTLLALFLSFVVGGLGSLLLIICKIKKRKDFIPFGPFLAIGGFTAYVFGTEILVWYFKNFFS